MKRSFSRAWVSSTQPRKQRKYRRRAPLHLRQKMLSAHLAQDLRKQFRRRALGVRKGDEVRIMRGTFAKTRGTVTKVDLKKLKVYIDSAKRRKVSAQEVQVALDPSNVMITKINLDDKERKKLLEKKLG